MFDQSKVGQSFPPFTVEIERGKVRELALAIGDDNPIYQSREAAQTEGYPDVPLPPTFPTTFAFWGNTQKIEQLASLGIDLRHVLHGEEVYTYFEALSPGDIITGVMTLTQARTTKGQGGSSMDVITFETCYTDQTGQPVLQAREVLIVRP